MWSKEKQLLLLTETQRGGEGVKLMVIQSGGTVMRAAQPATWFSPRERGPPCSTMLPSCHRHRWRWIQFERRGKETATAAYFSPA